MQVEIGINIMAAEGLFGGDLASLLDVVETADRKGIDFLTISDHLGFTGASHAERVEIRNFPYALGQPWLEPISFLSAAAARTTRIRLSTFILIAPLRPMLLLAKQLATLDVLSRGRVNIALGAGWQDVEFEVTRMPFEGRFGRLEEMVQAFRQVWGQAPANFAGKHFAFEDFYSYPLPPQGAALPVIFGMTPSPANLGRIARVADGWAADPFYVHALEEVAQALPAMFRENGRDPSNIQIHVMQRVIRTAAGDIDRQATRDAAHELVRKGATTVSFTLVDGCQTTADIEPFLDFLVSLKK
jgi:probable F420-dependent oxidoreductase